MEIYGYKRSVARTITTWIAILATGFLLKLIFYWKPQWLLYATCKRCKLSQATQVLLIDKYSQMFVESVELLALEKSDFLNLLFRGHNNNHSNAPQTPANHDDDDDDDECRLRCPDDDDDDELIRSCKKLCSGQTAAPVAGSQQGYGSFRQRHDEPRKWTRAELSAAKSGRVVSIPTASSSVAIDMAAGRSSLKAPSSQSLNNERLGFSDDRKRIIGGESSSSEESLGQYNKSSSSSLLLLPPAQAAADLSFKSPAAAAAEEEQANSEVVGVVESIRYFENKKLRFVWNELAQRFVRLNGLDKNITFDELKRMASRGHLSSSEQHWRLKLYNENAIRVQVQSYLEILFEEVLGPFYIFQLLSVILWFNDNYYYYATCIIIMSLVSLYSGVAQIRRNQVQLRDTVESCDIVKVFRGGDGGGGGCVVEEIESWALVPGDIVAVPTFNKVLQFDALLLNGNVIVNESMLTGESVPVTKTPITLDVSSSSSSSSSQKQANSSSSNNGDGCEDGNDDGADDDGINESFSSSVSGDDLEGSQAAAAAMMCYNEKEHSKHTLYSGTRVLQTRYYGGAHVKALVLRTGFQTTKGELIRSIMFPKPVDFRFNRQIHYFIGVLACCAMTGFVYNVALKYWRGAALKEILISSLDLITITVPPALPAAMTIGIIYAQSRLKKSSIFCISPRSINISGCINCVCFDKTGTLTEDDLSFNEIIPVVEDEVCFGKPFGEQVLQASGCAQSQLEHQLKLPASPADYSPLMSCLVSCHSLTKIDNQIIGDPLDLQMFQATNWILEEPDVDDENKFDLLAPTILRPPPTTLSTTTRRAGKIITGGDCAEQQSSSLSDCLLLEGEEEEQSKDEEEEEDTKHLQDIGVLRQFPFSSSLQRMSVVTRKYNGSNYVVYAKGAPEKIASLCLPQTIPADFVETLRAYTRKGFRVIALAYRPLKAGVSYAKMQRAPRSVLEKDLRFLGFLTLGNLLKPETTQVIRTLNKAALRTIMVTGDNMLTALSVANECEMISPFDKTILLELDTNSPAAAAAADGSLKMMSKSALMRARSQELGVSLMSEKRQSGGNGGNDVLASINLEMSLNDASRVNSLDPLILSAESVELQCTANETRPILDTTTTSNYNKSKYTSYVAPRSSSIKQQQQQRQLAASINRPKLKWHYVSQDNSALAAAAAHSSVSAANQRLVTDDSFILKLSDMSRLHLALTGDTWDTLNQHYPELVDSVCVRGTVFARMSPNQKQKLVERLQSLQYYVGMCGDGANDSGALRSAHAGISLSDTEASVAAPFTSKNANISCVLSLITEGRAALVTAFSILKYMALYSLTQFCSVILLYTSYSNFSDFEFMYEDLFIIALIVAFFGRTEPYPRLSPRPPPSSLLSLSQLSSCGIQLVLVVLFQAATCVTLRNKPWYRPHSPNYDHDYKSQDNYAIFAMSAFQCITLAIVFSKGRPYKKSILSNYPYAASLLIMILTTLVIILVPSQYGIPFTSISDGIPMDFKLQMLGLICSHFVLAMIAERLIVDRLLYKSCSKILELFGISPKKSDYERIDQETQTSLWLSRSLGVCV